jgi:hypothetical protein
VECDLLQYKNKVEITKGSHLLNLLNENNLGGVKKPSQKNHLPIVGACIDGVMGKGVLMNS